jgi:hypothetical protein
MDENRIAGTATNVGVKCKRASVQPKTCMGKFRRAPRKWSARRGTPLASLLKSSPIPSGLTRCRRIVAGPSRALGSWRKFRRGTMRFGWPAASLERQSFSRSGRD